ARSRGARAAEEGSRRRRQEGRSRRQRRRQGGRRRQRQAGRGACEGKARRKRKGGRAEEESSQEDPARRQEPTKEEKVARTGDPNGIRIRPRRASVLRAREARRVRECAREHRGDPVGLGGPRAQRRREKGGRVRAVPAPVLRRDGEDLRDEGTS